MTDNVNIFPMANNFTLTVSWLFQKLFSDLVMSVICDLLTIFSCKKEHLSRVDSVSGHCKC